MRYLIFLASILFIQACNTGETSGPSASERVQPPPPYWQVATPDFSDDPNRPTVTLNGAAVVTLALGEQFDDPGATASDLQDGDVSANIVVDLQFDNTVAGDYFVRYQVTDSSQKAAIDKVRILRVVDDMPVDISPRPFGKSQSHLGYIEHLPDDYGLDSQQTFPLLIYNHGSGANAEFAGSEPLAGLDLLLQNAGPPLLIQAGKWDAELPFIVLMPQLADVANIDPADRINAFIDYAINTYAIDESRIYMSGWSQGGFLSFLYAIEYPERVAAIASVSGGIPLDAVNLPDDFCNIENVPVWAFHGDADDIVPVDSSIDGVALIEANCQPTVLPRLTIFEGEDHVIHHSVFNLTSMQNGSLGSTTNPQYDPYDQSLFEWLLSFDLDDR